MRMKTTLFLFVAVLVVGGAFWYLEGRRGMDERRLREATRMFRLKPERVSQVTFEMDRVRVDCRMTNGIWRIVQPVNARADAGEMDRILTALSVLDKSEVITPRDRRELGLTLGDYGLERPRARIEWEDDYGRRVLLIGRDAPVGETVFVMVEGEDDILSVSSELLSIMPDSVLALRDRILFHGDPRRAYRVEIRRADGFLQVVKSEDGTWRLQQPIVAHADRRAVRQLIDRIFEWRIEDFVADAISDATVYGLDDAATQVTIYTEGQEAGQTVLLGAMREERNGLVYARRRDGQSVFSVPVATLEDVRVRPNDLRDRALMRVSRQDVDAVEIRYGEHELVLKRDTNTTWEIRAPKRWAADQALVKGLLDAWTGARIAAFVDEPDPDLAALGFADDAFQITFHVRSLKSALPLGEGAPNGTVTFNISSQPASESSLLVKKEGEPFLYEVPATVQEATSWNPLYYRHRTVIRLDDDSIRRVRQRKDGVEHAVERNGSGRFVPAPATKGNVVEEVLDGALDALTTLRVDEFLSDDPAGWEPYGLEDPQVVWTLDLTGEAGIRRVLMLGALRADGRVHARTRGQDVVFLLDRKDSALLLRSLFEADEAASPPVLSPELESGVE